MDVKIIKCLQDNYSYLLIARKSVLEDEYNFIKIKLFSELKKIR